MKSLKRIQRGRTRTYVQTGPSLSIASVGKSNEVALLEALKIGPVGLIRHTFVLNGALLTIREPADDEREPWIPPKGWVLYEE